MRIANFRDDVLWAIAYKLGLDPEVSLLKNQAYALASYINAYVRRIWDASDWPEWTIIGRFGPQTAPGLEHIVSWNHPPIEYIPPPIGTGPIPDAPAPVPSTPFIGKVLKVYLVDPRTTRLPVDTPFRLEHVGIHCGFEHGNSVWIKYIPRAPKFTGKEWDAGVTYKKDELTYSPLSGQCYKSKSSNNLGHDPSQPGGTSGPLLPPMVEETIGTPDNPGLAATPKIMDVLAALPVVALDAPAPAPIPDPPAAGSIGTIEVRSADGTTVLGTATHTATGTESLLAIFTILKDQFVTALTGFTVTLITSPLSIRLENASDYIVSTATATTDVGQTFPLAVVQVQAFVDATAPAPGQGQQFKLSLSAEQVVPGATYQLTFTTVDSIDHPAIYTALSTDNAQQILAGLIAAMITLQPADPFFTGVQSTLDTVSPSATFTIDKTVGLVSMDAEVIPPGSSFWELVPFPLVLVDQVVRGAYAEALKEGGQTDKGAAEEQIMPAENQVATAKFDAPEYPPLTDQQKPGSRYAVK